MGLWTITSQNVIAQASDPGAVGAGVLWTDTNANLTYRRNDANDGWNTIGSDTAVSATEYGYLDNVTSAIQTQIDAKQATLTATNITQQQPSNPAGTTSTAVFKMCGTAMTFTPTKSGKIQIGLSCNLSNNTASDGFDVKLMYGTGTAPVNDAALTGTQAGKLQIHRVGNAAAYVPACIIAYVSGLTLSTAYWFDLAQECAVGGTGTVVDINCVIEEMQV